MSVFSMVVMLVLIVCAYKVIIEGIRKNSDAVSADDAKLLQEVHRTLTRLEERVEALEGLVIDKVRQDDFERRLSS